MLGGNIVKLYPCGSGFIIGDDDRRYFFDAGEVWHIRHLTVGDYVAFMPVKHHLRGQVAVDIEPAP